MFFLKLIYFLTIRPLEILFETIFFISYRFIGKPFYTIIALSVFVNLLVFPLYKRADKLQSEQREREKSMEGHLSHIKKTFKGDEKVMMTQAYYRICAYKPLYALRGASSLLLQVPFFIAAYRFLSGLEMLKGMASIMLPFSANGSGPSFLINDLGAPDAMLTIGSASVNVLPILMTLINIVSGTIYSKGHLRKEKIQLYVTALVFLVLLYNSPSGLVIYWTCNNIFSLLKNFIQKLFEQRKTNGISKNVEHTVTNDKSPKIYDHVFLACAFLMALMTGLFIPSNVLSASATDFLGLNTTYNPANYLVYTFCLGIGFFVVWIGIYYMFMTGKHRKVLSCIMAICCGCAVVNYMMSGSGLGTISAYLKYDETPSFAVKSMLVNLLLMVAVVTAMILILRFKPAFSGLMAIAGCAALVVASISNIGTINKDFMKYITDGQYINPESEMPRINLSKTGKNVVIILLDRAMGPQLVYMLNERPDLFDTYDGFTFYHDTVSFGSYTNFAMPAVYGGYEYTPYEMNKRDGESLKDKTNEALRVLPVLFDDNGYGVTVFDPPYANYKVYSDLSIYNDHPDINAYISKRNMVNMSGEYVDYTEEVIKRNLFCFADMKTVPLFLQNILYDEGRYHDSKLVYKSGVSDESLEGKIGVGYTAEFYSWYSVLENLSKITHFSENEKGEFLMMYNCTTHEPQLLQLPDYKPEMYVDNTAFDVDKYYTMNGISINMEGFWQAGHYDVNMAALLRIGEWLDYLKEEGVYDNTRIIITSDHGRAVGWFDNFTFGNNIETLWYMPLLMVKDFDAHGFQTSSEFMTNADACVMAVQGDVVKEAVNPFTGNPLDGHQKNEDFIKIITSEDWYPREGNKFPASDWYTVTGTPYDNHNWEYLFYE